LSSSSSPVAIPIVVVSHRAAAHRAVAVAIVVVLTRRSLVGCCFVITCRHATIIASLPAAFADKLSSTASTPAAATVSPPPSYRRRHAFTLSPPRCRVALCATAALPDRVRHDKAVRSVPSLRRIVLRSLSASTYPMYSYVRYSARGGCGCETGFFSFF
jgi:hypothetical protein